MSNPVETAIERGDEPVRVFIGSDENQKLAQEVLASSLRRNASLRVDVRSLENVTTPEPAREELRTRTGFTFRRFRIPELCGWSGRAIYLDADMLVFDDIADVWRAAMPPGVSVLFTAQDTERARRAQFAVMLLDCAALDWKIEAIVDGLNEGRWSYEELVYELALIPLAAKAPGLSTRWNALDRYVEGTTALVHYTAMPMQPWIYPYHPLRDLWYDALRTALAEGDIDAALIEEEIAKGHVSPQLPRWAKLDIDVPPSAARGWLPPYLKRITQMRSDPMWRMTCAVRARTVWAPWFRRIVTKLP